jgi:hypothetical protein
MPADAVETAALRAGSLARTLGDTLAATHLSAAWVHGALPGAPGRHTVQRAVSRRLHVVPDRRLIYRDLQIPTADLEVVGGVFVATRERTLADLVRVGDDEHHRAARLLSVSDPDAATRAIERLEAGTLPHKRAALVRLRSIVAGIQDDVTR